MAATHLRFTVSGPPRAATLKGGFVLLPNQNLVLSRAELAAAGWGVEDFLDVNRNPALAVEYLDQNGRELSKDALRAAHADEIPPPPESLQQWRIVPLATLEKK